ncbi:MULTISPECIES: hypothetical protein [unclassified Blastococcus]
MATDPPDMGDFLDRAQRMLRELFGDAGGEESPWGAAAARDRAGSGRREPSPERQRENLTFALATRAVEALEDLALNVAAIRQRLERLDPRPEAPPAAGPGAGGRTGTDEGGG